MIIVVGSHTTERVDSLGRSAFSGIPSRWCLLLFCFVLFCFVLLLVLLLLLLLLLLFLLVLLMMMMVVGPHTTKPVDLLGRSIPSNNRNAMAPVDVLLVMVATFAVAPPRSLLTAAEFEVDNNNNNNNNNHNNNNNNNNNNMNLFAKMPTPPSPQRSIRQSLHQSTHQSMHQSIHQQLMQQSIQQSIQQSTQESIQQQSMQQSIQQSTQQSTHQSIQQAMHESVEQSLQQTMVVQYSDTGAMTIVLDGDVVIAGGLPDIEPYMWNGTACTPFVDYNYARLHHTTTWNATTSTSNLQYGWGGFTVKHTRTGPLSVDVEIVLSNNPKNRTNKNLLVPLCDVNLMLSTKPINTSSSSSSRSSSRSSSHSNSDANSDTNTNTNSNSNSNTNSNSKSNSTSNPNSNFNSNSNPNSASNSNPNPNPSQGYIEGSFGPCPGCWHHCGCVPGRCGLEYPQAIAMDFGTAAAAWVQTTCANVSGFEISANSCPTRGYYRPTVMQAEGRRLEVNANVTISVSLRFGQGSHTTGEVDKGAVAIVKDTLLAYGKQHPFNNVDLRGGAMAEVFACDTTGGASFLCNSSAPSDCPNPRGWNFLGCQGKRNQSMCNVTTAKGIAHFEQATRDYFNQSIARCLKLKCRALVLWSIEGAEWGDITYVGSPDMLHVLAPEMDKMADEIFSMINAAGIRAGVTLRPQIITRTPDWNSSVPPNHPPWPYYQKKLLLPTGAPDEDAITSNLFRKASYAIKRWNTTVFYVDSTGSPLVSVWARLRALLPNIVFIPEQSDYSLDFSTVTPLQDNWGGNPIGVGLFIKAIWPQAYNYQLMQMDVNETRTPVRDWVPLAKEGDVFRVDGWYDSKHNAFIERVLAAAAAGEEEVDDEKG